jgi:hypothetical protein
LVPTFVKVRAAKLYERRIQDTGGPVPMLAFRFSGEFYLMSVEEDFLRRRRRRNNKSTVIPA